MAGFYGKMQVNRKECRVFRKGRKVFFVDFACISALRALRLTSLESKRLNHSYYYRLSVLICASICVNLWLNRISYIYNDNAAVAQLVEH